MQLSDTLVFLGASARIVVYDKFLNIKKYEITETGFNSYPSTMITYDEESLLAFTYDTNVYVYSVTETSATKIYEYNTNIVTYEIDQIKFNSNGDLIIFNCGITYSSVNAFKKVNIGTLLNARDTSIVENSIDSSINLSYSVGGGYSQYKQQNRAFSINLDTNEIMLHTGSVGYSGSNLSSPIYMFCIISEDLTTYTTVGDATTMIPFAGMSDYSSRYPNTSSYSKMKNKFVYNKQSKTFFLLMSGINSSTNSTISRPPFVVKYNTVTGKMSWEYLSDIHQSIYDNVNNTSTMSLDVDILGRMHLLDNDGRVILDKNFNFISGANGLPIGIGCINKVTNDMYSKAGLNYQAIVTDSNFLTLNTTKTFGDNSNVFAFNQIACMVGSTDAPPLSTENNSMVYPTDGSTHQDTTPTFVFRAGVTPNNWKVGFRFIATKNVTALQKGDVDYFRADQTANITAHVADSSTITVDGTPEEVSTKFKINDVLLINSNTYTISSINGNDITLSETITGTLSGTVDYISPDHIIDSFDRASGSNFWRADVTWELSEDYNESVLDPEDVNYTWNSFVTTGTEPTQGGAGEGISVTERFKSYIRFTLPNDIALSADGDTWYFGLFSYSKSI